MNSTENKTACCLHCLSVFKLVATKGYGPITVRKYCSDKCKYEAFKRRQQSKIEAKRLADKLLKEAEVAATVAAKKVNYYKEVYRKARAFARASEAPAR